MTEVSTKRLPGLTPLFKIIIFTYRTIIDLDQMMLILRLFTIRTYAPNKHGYFKLGVVWSPQSRNSISTKFYGTEIIVSGCMYIATNGQKKIPIIVCMYI